MILLVLIRAERGIKLGGGWLTGHYVSWVRCLCPRPVSAQPAVRQLRHRLDPLSRILLPRVCATPCTVCGVYQALFSYMYDVDAYM
jgi:hypothetical protein